MAIDPFNPLDSSAELERLKAENERLKQRDAEITSYLRTKIDSMLKTMGTFPLRADELDDEHMIVFDPIGIVTTTFGNILENLRDTNRQLELARDEISAIFEAAGTGILVLDDQRRILSYNRKIVEQFNFAPGQIVGEPCSSLLCHNQVDVSNCVFFKVMESGEGEQTFAWRFGERYFDVYGAPVKGNDGKVVQVVIVYLEVTDRIMIEQALQRALHRVDAIVQAISDGLLVVDAAGVVVKANQASEAFLGCREADMLGHYVGDFFPDTQLGEEIARALERQASPQPFDLMLNRGSGGSARCYQARISLLDSVESSGGGLVLSLHDVTHERTVERMKSEFVSTAAHELRTPLSTIIGYSELLLDIDGFSSEQKVEFMQLIHQKAEELSDLIDDLLDISRIESGQDLKLDLKIFSLEGLVKKNLEFFVHGSAHHHFQLLPTTGEVLVEADPVRYGQVLDNLLSNAVKYSPDGGEIVVAVSTEADFARVTIRDQGMGMTPEQVAHVFDKFYRANTTNTAISGTGLGMTIVHDLVAAHGGTVQVESELGAGTTVSFTLPLAKG